MKRLYKYVALVAAKLVGRRHPRDIKLPGLKELKNAFVSKSDNAITVRPDFDPIAEDLLAVSSSFATTVPDDYLNSASGMYGTDDLIWWSSMSPVTWDGTESQIACSSYTTGTVSVSNGSKNLVGVGTEWIENIWPGCWIELGSEYYKIDEVNSDTACVFSEDATQEYAAASYTIYRPHQPDFADYKLNLQPFTSGMIYSSPTITMPIDAKKICGPFYASVVESQTEEVFVSFKDDDVEIDGYGAYDVVDDNIATDGTNWMCLPGELSGTGVICKSTDPGSDWSSVTPPSNFTPHGNIYHYNSKFYMPGLDTSSNKMAYAVTSNVGNVWTVVDNSSAVSGISASGIAVSPGNRIVVTSNDGANAHGLGKIAWYTDDNGTTWAESDAHNVDMPYEPKYIYYDNSMFVCMIYLYTGTTYSYYSSDGASFELGPTFAGTNYLNYGAYSTSGDFWLFVDTNATTVAKINSDFSSGSTIDTGLSSIDGISWCGDKFLLPSAADEKIYSTTNGIDYEDEYSLPADYEGVLGVAYSNISREAVVSCNYPGPVTADGVRFVISGQTQTTTEWRAASFEPLSDDYRSLTHSVLDGYVMLLGTREFQATNNQWEYHPRRIRWTAPLTYNDFSSSGSGVADLDGSGAILDSRTANGRIITFESSQIGAISPRGYTTDPWEYDVIKQNIRSISNPVVVDDVCYFIDDTGILRATNGMTVDEPPFSFDLTEYDDFNSDMPIWLSYSPELESLVVFNAASSDRYVYHIEVGSGSVSRFELATVDNDGSALSPKSIACVEHSSDRRMMVGYNPRNDNLDSLLVAELSTGSTVTGKDEWTADASDDTYFVTDIQTPEDWIIKEGAKTGIKHVIARTYCDGTSSTTNPVVAVQCKSMEDTDWHDNGDRTGTITVTDAACTGSGTAWSNTLDATNDPVYTTPCLATQARVYDNDVLQVLGTDYTITDTKEITLSGAATGTVKVYWENEPSIRVTVGGLIQTTEGWHRITAITNATTLTLDHYLSTGSDATATHHPAERMPVGDGEVKIGILKLTEGTRVRFIIMPDASGDATVAKITGYSVGHIPAGGKIVEVE